MDNTENQLPIFGFKDNLPSVKLKKMISKERLEEAKAAYIKGDLRSTLENLRTAREGLERYCNRIKNGK